MKLLLLPRWSDLGMEVHIPRLRSTLLFVIVMSLFVGCGRLTKPPLVFFRSQSIGKFGETNLIGETWNHNAIMGQPVWRVCQNIGANTNLQILFTVEAEFQESEPGYPLLVTTNGLQVIQDEGGSYVFTLANRKFLTNRFPADVYIGDVRR